MGCAIDGGPDIGIGMECLACGFFAIGFAISALVAFRLVAEVAVGFKDASVKRVLWAMGPAIFGASVTQINLLLDAFIA